MNGEMGEADLQWTRNLGGGFREERGREEAGADFVRVVV
jgi:hypothetical protein